MLIFIYRMFFFLRFTPIARVDLFHADRITSIINQSSNIVNNINHTHHQHRLGTATLRCDNSSCDRQILLLLLLWYYTMPPRQKRSMSAPTAKGKGKARAGRRSFEPAPAAPRSTTYRTGIYEDGPPPSVEQQQQQQQQHVASPANEGLLIKATNENAAGAAAGAATAVAGTLCTTHDRLSVTSLLFTAK